MKRIVNNRSVITRTPMRVTLGGGGTDVYWYSKLRGGAWISGAINKYIFISLNSTDDPNLLKVFDGNEYLIASDSEQIKNPIVWLCLKKTKIKTGIQITTVSEVSGRSGLGGSGSFEVGLLNTLYTFKNKKITPLKLGEYATHIEAEKLKKPVGPQDQYIAALGGIHYFEIDTKGKVFVQTLNLSEKTVQALEKNMLYFSTGINRDADLILGDQKNRSESSNNISSKVINSMDKIKKIGQDVKRYLIKGDTDAFGYSLHEHWLIKKSLSDRVANTEIDSWYNHGIENGALGGKIMGAGGGGWFVFYVNRNHDKFRKKMKKLGLIPQIVKFDWEGTKVIYDR